MVSRRTIVSGIAATIGGSLPFVGMIGRAFGSDLASLLAQLDSSASRGAADEEAFQQMGPSPTQVLGNPQLPRRWYSEKDISDDAFKLIVACEVTNQAVYEDKYEAPTWPQKASGVTVGIGYDLGYQTSEDIEQDWGTLLSQADISLLETAAGLKGASAKAALPEVAAVRVKWDPALANFRLVLRFYAGQTERFFPNSSSLSPKSFGALVSLVFNRGSSSKSSALDPLDRRKEIRKIKSLCVQKKFSDIPAEIRSMKRLWANDRKAAGLVLRREAEAVLFEDGLA